MPLTHNALGEGRGDAARIRVGLIDCFHARRDYFIEMLARTHPDLEIVAFFDFAACIESPTLDLDVILYCDTEDSSPVSSILDHVDLLRNTFANVPIVVLPAIGRVRAAVRSSGGNARLQCHRCGGHS